MPEPGFPYPEEILQWIWEEQIFDSANLRTTDGRSLEILNPGILNESDGPDFKNAQVIIDGILWGGAIELHLESKGWMQHGHHKDKAYNQVVLHVVAEYHPGEVVRKDGGRLPTLNILPRLPRELHHFVAKMNASPGLPCSSGINYISEQAFFQQIEKAHKEYLEKKGNDFLRFYNPELQPSKAWKEALIISLFDSFGISHNRDAMAEVGRWFLNQATDSEDRLTEGALEMAGFGTSLSGLEWNYKGVYPASHPQKRIPQAIRFASGISKAEFESFLNGNNFLLWWELGNSAGVTRAKLKSLYGLVYIPSMFMLGQLFGSQIITQQALDEWNTFNAKVPSSFTKLFDFVNPEYPERYRTKLGIVHQYRSYCKPRRCHECFVLKKVISS